MRIALCLYGIIGAVEGKYGQGSPIDPRIGYEMHDRHIFHPNADHEIDIFMHSWSTDFKDFLVELYNPKKQY